MGCGVVFVCFVLFLVGIFFFKEAIIRHNLHTPHAPPPRTHNINQILFLLYSFNSVNQIAVLECV